MVGRLYFLSTAQKGAPKSCFHLFIRSSLEEVTIIFGIILVEPDSGRVMIEKELTSTTSMIPEKIRWRLTSFQPDRIPSTIGSLSCLAVTFTTQQINS